MTYFTLKSVKTKCLSQISQQQQSTWASVVGQFFIIKSIYKMVKMFQIIDPHQCDQIWRNSTILAEFQIVFGNFQGLFDLFLGKVCNTVMAKQSKSLFQNQQLGFPSPLSIRPLDDLERTHQTKTTLIAAFKSILNCLVGGLFGDFMVWQFGLEYTLKDYNKDACFV